MDSSQENVMERQAGDYKVPVIFKPEKKPVPKWTNDDTMTAAAEVHTGAMIALKLSDADAQRIAVDGGEDPNELHITLAYLGEAALIPAEVQEALIDCVSRCTAGISTVVGNVFAVNMFNPDPATVVAGAYDSCVTLGVGGAQIDRVHQLIMTHVEDVFHSALIDVHEQHKPWVPHITLVYTDDADLSYFVDRVGPVTFDAVRIAFGGENYDIPLGDNVETTEYDDNDMTAGGDIEMAKEKDVNIKGGSGHQLRDYWVHGEGAAKIGWKTPGDWTRCVAELSKHVKDPKGLCSEYHHMATGMWPGDKRNPGMDDDTVTFDDTVLYDTDGAEKGDGGEVSTVAAASNPDEPYGDVKYADPGYQSDGKKRYPLDTDKHVRAAWSYISQPDNAAKYQPTQLKQIKSRIRRAMAKIGATVTDAKGSDADTITAADALMATSPNGWQGVLTVEGVESGDGRMFAPNALSWDEPPLPLMWQKETSHGGKSDVSVRVGSIDKIWREPDAGGRADINLINGSGTIDVGHPDGREVMRRMKRGYMRGNSVDVDSVKDSDVELVYPESIASPLAAGDGSEEAMPLMATFGSPELTKYHKGRIRATTLVEIPAFTEARLELMNNVVAASADDTDTADEESVSVTPDDNKSVTAQQLEAIVAATSTINISDAPPRDWFSEPTDVTPQGALTVTSEGRVFGYIAPAGVRHRSFRDRIVNVPLKKVDYSRFMGGETIVSDGGRVSTGAVTMNCGHASTTMNLSAPEAAEHYDNTCSMVATVCVGENQNGVWMAGALLPDVTPNQVRRIMASRLSGDWRGHLDKPGWREFVAALLVPVPGFPMARTSPSVSLADGLLVASSVPVQFAQVKPDDEDEDDNSKDVGEKPVDDADVPADDVTDKPADKLGDKPVDKKRVNSIKDRMKAIRDSKSSGVTTGGSVDSKNNRVAALRARVRGGE
jgi:2'-5' RNA ligase